MTLKQIFCHARQILNARNIEDSSLNCELMLRHILQISRVEFYLKLDNDLTFNEEREFWILVQRMLSGEPTAYIIGHREFYGIEFIVNTDVFIPRPESELLVEKALAIEKKCHINTIAEVGTGCGSIAISLSLNSPQAKIIATDISSCALDVARANCANQGQDDRICFFQGDLLAPIKSPVELIIANLPYIKTTDIAITNFEPQLALDGGFDGLDCIRRLCLQLKDKLIPNGHLILEIGKGQKKSLIAFLRELFPSVKIEIYSDMQGIDRVVCLTLPSIS